MDVAGGNRHALRLLIGQAASQTFAFDADTIVLLWQGKVPTVISPSQLKVGDRFVVRVRADRGSTLAAGRGDARRAPGRPRAARAGGVARALRGRGGALHPPRPRSYPRSVLRFALAALAAALLASPAAAAAPRYSFGRSGGNIAPFTVTIAPSGKVSVSGPAKVGRTSLTPAQLAGLRAAISAAKLSSLPARTSAPARCRTSPPSFVTAGGRTVAVRGSCSPPFRRAWFALVSATRLANG